jgi:hypothetical protein
MRSFYMLFEDANRTHIFWVKIVIFLICDQFQWSFEIRRVNPCILYTIVPVWFKWYSMYHVIFYVLWKLRYVQWLIIHITSISKFKAYMFFEKVKPSKIWSIFFEKSFIVYLIDIDFIFCMLMIFSKTLVKLDIV